MAFERHHKTGNVLLHFKEVFTLVDFEGLHLEQMPGARQNSLDIRTTEMSRDISEITFFIAPLENGVQDFGIWKEPMKIDSWADPSFVKIEEVDMKDIQKVLIQ
jgi:hypothetical protein